MSAPRATMAFALVAFGIPWIAWTVSGLLEPSSRLSRSLVYAGDFCSIGGLVAAYVADGWGGVRGLLSRSLRFRVPAHWWGIVVLLPVGYVSAAFVAGSALAARSVAFDPGAFRGLYSLPAIAMFLTGPLGEELGWRGYLLPRLLARHSVLVSSVVVGIVWGLWHLPLYVRGVFASLATAAVFVAGTITTSVLMSVIFVHTRASVLVAIVYHWLINVLPITFYRAFGFTEMDLTVELLQLIAKVVLIALLYSLIGSCRLEQARLRVIGPDGAGLRP